MPEISNKKRKFIKRNFRQLSIVELARQTGLKPHVIRSVIDEYTTEIPGKGQFAQIKNGVYMVRPHLLSDLEPHR